MRKNVGSQTICAQLISKTDGSDVTTGTTTVYYTIDGGSQTSGGGTVAHEGNGCWSYVPAQAETNGAHIAFTFVNTNAVTSTVNVYTVGQDFTAAQLDSNVTQLSGDATAANNAESFFDGTGYAGTNNVIPTVTAVTNGVSLADDAITAAKSDENTAFPLKSADTGATAVARTGADSDTLETLSDEIATAQADLDTLTGVDGATLATLQANYAPAVAGDAMTLTSAYDPAKTAAQAGDAMTLANDAVSAAALAADALAEIKAELEAVLSNTSRAELASVPASNASLTDKINWGFTLLRNRRAQTNTTETVYADDGATPIATSTKTDDGTTYTRGEYA